MLRSYAFVVWLKCHRGNKASVNSEKGEYDLKVPCLLKTHGEIHGS